MRMEARYMDTIEWLQRHGYLHSVDKRAVREPEGAGIAGRRGRPTVA